MTGPQKDRHYPLRRGFQKKKLQYLLPVADVLEADAGVVGTGELVLAARTVALVVAVAAVRLAVADPRLWHTALHQRIEKGSRKLSEIENGLKKKFTILVLQCFTSTRYFCDD